MKVIDRTPFKGPDGKISAMDRVRASMKYGSSWYDDVQAQDAAAAVLGRQLDRTYTLLVNAPLPGTDVLLPMVLVGPPGVFLIYITNERGVFQARGEEWGTLSGERFVPDKVNLLTRTVRMSQALGKFLLSQGFDIPMEPVLLAVNPGMHIDSMRPVIRVMLSDGLERFAISLAQGKRILIPEIVAAISDRILNPRAPRKPAAAAAPTPAPATPAYIPQGQEPAAAVADEPVSAESLGFAFDEAAQPEVAPGSRAPVSASRKPVPSGSQRKGGVRISRGQWFALGCLFVVFVIILSTIIVLAVMNA
jgi:hypothetical protein